MEKFNLDEGKWRTVGGRRIFIRNGESLSSAMKKSGKFKAGNKIKNNKAVRDTKEPYKQEKKYNEVNIEEENKRLEIAKEIAKELNPSLKNASDNLLEKRASEIMAYSEGEPLSEGETPYTNRFGEIERSTNSLKEWRDSLRKSSYDKKLKEWINSPVDDEEEKLKRERAKNEAYYKLNGRPARNMQESIEKNQSEGAKFSKMLEENNVKTFADELKETTSKNDNKTIKQLNDEMLGDTYKGKGNTPNLIYSNNRRIDIANNENGGKTATIWKDGKIERKTILPDNVKGDKTKDYFDKYLGDLDKKTNSQFEVSDLKTKALASLPKEHIDTHGSDLYIKKTKESDALLENMKNKNSGLLTTFKDQQTGETWYDVPFGNMGDDFKEKTSGNQINNALRQKAYQKYLKEHPTSKITFNDFKDMKNLK